MGRLPSWLLLLAGCASTSGEAAPSSSLDVASTTRAFGGPVPRACEGPSVDLAALAGCRCAGTHPPTASSPPMVQAGTWCGERFEGPVSSGVAVDVRSSSADVAPGGTLDLRLRFHNRASATAPLRFEGGAPVRRVQVLDAEGRDVTTSGTCGHGASRPGNDYLVLLTPGGEASAALRWEATQLHGEQHGHDCIESRRPYPPGTYRLVLHTALASPDPVPAPTALVHVR